MRATRVGWANLWDIITANVVTEMCTGLVVACVIAFVIGDEINKRRR